MKCLEVYLCQVSIIYKQVYSVHVYYTKFIVYMYPTLACQKVRGRIIKLTTFGIP